MNKEEDAYDIIKNYKQQRRNELTLPLSEGQLSVVQMLLDNRRRSQCCKSMKTGATPHFHGEHSSIVQMLLNTSFGCRSRTG
ncbi:hypothetical protein ACNVED_16270 (plasmid) [Legionella sp. D16C41]|uniref:hypothetical protein n=1 Tax=Legionella sp. D16C41 TaxID=3402688 RepID=UPI003AF86F7A